jgi:hypothetical protein
MTLETLLIESLKLAAKIEFWALLGGWLFRPRR